MWLDLTQKTINIIILIASNTVELEDSQMGAFWVHLFVTYTASVVFALMVADLLKFVLNMIFTYSAVYAEMASWQYIYFLKEMYAYNF